jgi:hypothetical protein
MNRLATLEKQGRLGQRQKIIERDFMSFIKSGGRLRGGLISGGSTEPPCACGSETITAGGGQEMMWLNDPTKENVLNLNINALYPDGMPESRRQKLEKPVLYSNAQQNSLRRELMRASERRPFVEILEEPVEYSAAEQNLIRRQLLQGSASAKTDQFVALRKRILDEAAMAKYGKPYNKLPSVTKGYFGSDSAYVKDYINAGQTVKALT